MVVQGVLQKAKCNGLTTWMLHIPDYHIYRDSFLSEWKQIRYRKHIKSGHHYLYFLNAAYWPA